MGIVFKATHPVFGRGADTKGVAYQQRSPYYWWFEFLARNDDYQACCAAGGSGALADLYADFGPVGPNSDFKAWWSQRGYRLFAEQRKPVQLHELTTAADWDPLWQPAQVMVVAVPLDLPKRYLLGFFARLLKQRHGGKRGRKALSDPNASSARYPLHRNVSIHTLRIQLAVYDAVIAKKQGKDRRTLAQIGADLGLVSSAKPKRSDTPKEAADKRAVLSASVSRHFRMAQRIVANTARGQFPNSR
jgi:hypothetical protein